MKFIIKRQKDRLAEKVQIKITNRDALDLYFTAGCLLLPMFERFKRIKRYIIVVNDDDVPVELKSKADLSIGEYLLDSNYQARNDWLLSEIIWALKKVQSQRSLKIVEFLSAEEYEKQQARLINAFSLMGKYWLSFWE